ncbi:helix-turn-helix transcriptional regulator [Clostridium neonatale]|nr:helix-turn-helix domain-containing protein [Clostridium neonatale]
MNELIKLRKITQEELAESVKITRQTIISIENGNYNASLILLHKITKFF